MIDIDSISQIASFDKGNILTSIRTLGDQIKQVHDEMLDFTLPASYQDIYNVVVCGMGGSALGARIVKALTFDSARIPIEIYNDYKLPYYVGEKTLVILSSYSGGTEETISSAYKAFQVGAKVVGISSGGKLTELLREKNAPAYIFEPKENASGQPRMGLGYSTAAFMKILSTCCVINITDAELLEAAATVRKYTAEFDAKVPESKNLAKILARKLIKKAPIIFASEHLFGPAYAFKNQLNESAKTFSTIFELPEANHHLLEGLQFPEKEKHVFHFLFFDSNLYSPEIAKRYPITHDVVTKCGHESTIYRAQSTTKITEIFEILTLGSYISFYLALLNNVNPVEIPWVDYFKKQLAK